MTVRPSDRGGSATLPQRLRHAALGARWAARELARLRRTLGPDGLGAEVGPPPTRGRGGLRGARALLTVRRATCLERSLVVQAWFASVGVPLDVIVGVKSSPGEATGVKIHAWVDRFDRDQSAEYRELRRVTP